MDETGASISYVFISSFFVLVSFITFFFFLISNNELPTIY